MDSVAKIILGFILVLFVAILMIHSNIRDNFRHACNNVGGTTVWDGRQYQCFKPESSKKE